MNAKAKLINWDRLGEVLSELQAQKRWKDLLLVSVATFTGCRPGDWTTFTWDVFLHPDGTPKSQVKIFEKKPTHILEAKGKKPKARPIFLMPQFQETLVACWKGLNEPYLHLSMFQGARGPKRSGISINTANTRICALAIEFELPHITTYSFRRTCGRKIHDSTADPKLAPMLAQRFYNHSNIASTMAYIGLSDEETEAAFGKLQF